MRRLQVLTVFAIGLASCGDRTAAPEDDGGDSNGSPPEDAAGDADATGPTVALPEDLDLSPRSLTGYVDPFIGSEGPGNVIPGALVPHGVVRASPDTNAPFGSIDAYEWSNDRIEGFTHTHLEGPGGSQNGYSQLLLLPQTGPLETEEVDYAEPFDHATEEAKPGYYAVTLGGSGVRVELTATGHAAVHRYVFPPAEAARILLDVGHSNGQSAGGHVEVVSEDALEGFGEYQVHPVIQLALGDEPPTGHARVFFRVQLDRPMTGHGVWKGKTISPGEAVGDGKELGAWMAVDAAEGAAVEVRVGISYVDLEQARQNLEDEVGGRSFDEVADAADAAWNERLDRVRVDGDEAAKEVFYTALYHSLLQPADHTEGGRYHLAASRVHEVFDAGPRRYYTDDWCMWDTFRTTHPLQLLVSPETRDDVAWSMLRVYEHGGWLEKCSWAATGYSRVMIGHHAVAILADLVVKGFSGFDLGLAFEAAKKAGMEDNPNPGEEGLCGYFNLGTAPSYLALGYVPTECDPTQAASMTLEYAYDDFCIARLAEAAGAEADRAYFDERAGNWRNQLDPETGFMRGRHDDGSWVEPFDPADGSDVNDFVESTAWTYTFHVQHDVPGLVDALGGPGPFLAKLEEFFAGGHFDMSNEPGFHAPFLFALAGAPHRTQAVVRDLLATRFGAGPGGLPGNDDAGATSAWYVFAALGFYPVAPGDPRYVLSSPLFERAVLRLDPAFHPADLAPVFVLDAPRSSPTDVYIQSATLNGAPLDRPWLTHDEIVRGGHLLLQLGPDPSPLWAAAGAAPAPDAR